MRRRITDFGLIAVLSIDRHNRTPARIMATIGERPVPLRNNDEMLHDTGVPLAAR